MKDMVEYYKKLVDNQLVPPDFLTIDTKSWEELMSTDRGFITNDYISRIDNDIVNGTLDLSWCKELGVENPGNFDCDVLIDDGDEFTFGTTKIRFKSAPGHTLGTLAIFAHLCENGEKIVAAMHGGAGLNTLNDEYIAANGLPSNLREIFRKSLHDLSTERVDLVLGNHPQQNDTAGKLQKVLSGEKITDRGEWQTFLKNTELSLDRLEARS